MDKKNTGRSGRAEASPPPLRSARVIGYGRPMPRPFQMLFLACGVALIATQLSYAAAAEERARPDWTEFNRLIARSQTMMMAHPDDALAAAQRAAKIAGRHQHQLGYNKALATALWLEAEALTRTNRISPARNAAAIASRLAASDGKLTKLDGDLALSRARIAESGGDFATALRNYQQAHDVFAKLGIARGQSLALLGLGDLYGRARDFQREIRYYREAAQNYTGDQAFAFGVSNNVGFAYLQMHHYAEAIPRFQQALGIARSLKSPLLEASILPNLAFSYARVQRLTEAERAVDRSLALAGKRDDGEEARFAWGVKAEVDYRRGSIGAAIADLQKAFHGIDLKTTTPRFLGMHEIAYEVYRAYGDLPLAMAHLEAFKRLDDRGRSLAASVNLALLGAQFDFARQQLEIEHLKSADLARDVKLRKSQAEVQATIFTSIILAGIVLMAWFAWRHMLLNRHRNAIAQKNSELLKTLAERDREIERRNEVESHLRLAIHGAQQASRAKSHFLANMSHELRTPLNAIIGFSELILTGRIKLDKSKEYARDIAEGGRHLLAVLNNVLDMARMESGKVELDERVVRLGDVVDHVITVLGGWNTLAGKEVRIAGDGSILVRGDEVRLRQVVINLVSNAVKFTGGLVEIRIERTGDGADIVVRDNGEGIPADKLPIIMEPFGQAESTYARSHGGVGLGLPIVKALVELHGGRFTIESECGSGTTARVHLPQERVLSPSSHAAAVRSERAA